MEITSSLPGTDESVVAGLIDFVDKTVVPLEDANAQILEDSHQLYDETGAYSEPVRKLMRQVRAASAEAGYYAMLCPEDVGGGGLGAVSSYYVWEALYHRYGPARLLPFHTVAHWTSGPSYLCRHMSPDVRAEILPGLMSGNITMCFAMSEPEAGSDAWAMRTSAVRDGDEWIINGTKQWISNSPYAQYALLFATTDQEASGRHRGGISCFLLPMSTPGVAIDSVIKLFGHSGGNEAILSFTDVRVGADCLVGEVGRGFELAVGGVSLGRMYNAGRCVGLARWALERSVSYAKQRKTFGRPISDYQGVAFPLADSAIEIQATKLMALDCARRIDNGERATRDMAMVKAYATEMCFRVYDRCMQVHGGMGFTNEMKLYDGWMQARVIRVADGSGEIMRRNIARSLINGDIDF
jgi:acyl-CoA dehydrogenase